MNRSSCGEHCAGAYFCHCFPAFCLRWLQACPRPLTRVFHFERPATENGTLWRWSASVTGVERPRLQTQSAWARVRDRLPSSGDQPEGALGSGRPCCMQEPLNAPGRERQGMPCRGPRTAGPASLMLSSLGWRPVRAGATTRSEVPVAPLAELGVGRRALRSVRSNAPGSRVSVCRCSSATRLCRSVDPALQPSAMAPRSTSRASRFAAASGRLIWCATRGLRRHYLGESPPLHRTVLTWRKADLSARAINETDRSS